MFAHHLTRTVDALLRLVGPRMRLVICLLALVPALGSVIVGGACAARTSPHIDEVTAHGEWRQAKVMEIDHYPGGRRRQEYWAVSLRLTGPGPGVFIEFRCETRPACGLHDAEVITVRVDAGDPRFAVTADGIASDAFDLRAGLWLIATAPIGLFTFIVVLPALYRVRTRPEEHWSRFGPPPARRGRRQRRRRRLKRSRARMRRR